MSDTQAERAVNQLYESDSIRSELRDEEASLLLSWGESRLSELAERDLPDDQFDQLSESFRSLLAAINVCVGKRKTSPSQHLSMMATISSAAEAAGYVLHPEDQTGFLKHQAGLANQDAISELLGLLKPAEATQPPSQTIGEAVAELVPSEPVAAVHDEGGELRTSPPNPLSVYSEGEQNDTQTASDANNAAQMPSEPVSDVHNADGEIKISNPISVQSEGEQTPEHSGAQNDTQSASGADNAAPRPEELPEQSQIPPQSPQEG